jgi:hypothetical protein
VIVKSGDDCRQELLALQLIRELGDIWAGERLAQRVNCCIISALLFAVLALQLIREVGGIWAGAGNS